MRKIELIYAPNRRIRRVYKPVVAFVKEPGLDFVLDIQDWCQQLGIAIKIPEGVEATSLSPNAKRRNPKKRR
jgi:hypothetical protein